MCLNEFDNQERFFSSKFPLAFLMSTALGGIFRHKNREVPVRTGNPVDSLKNSPVIRFFSLITNIQC